MIVDVFLVKVQATIYTGDYPVLKNHRLIQPPTFDQSLIDRILPQNVPDFPLSEEQLKHVRIEPDIIHLDKTKVKTVETPDGQVREAIIGAELFLIIKAPKEYGLDNAKVFDILSAMEQTGVGKYGRMHPLEVHHIGQNEELSDEEQRRK